MPTFRTPSRPLKVRLILMPALAALLLMTAFEASALGCSCAGGTAKDLLRTTPASFIGKLESFRKLDDRFSRARYRYSVNRSFERDLGSSVIVTAGVQGSACGLPKTEEKKIALGLTGKPGHWVSGSCYRRSISGLREAAKDEGSSSSRTSTLQCGEAAKAAAVSVARLTDALALS